jgi:Cys-tRNA(Pro)/Cys-tRNA(Cys) deacylase
LTGLQAGGISPLALLNRGFQVLLDRSALDHPEIHVSGGQLGLEYPAARAGFIDLTRARTANISKPALRD